MNKPAPLSSFWRGLKNDWRQANFNSYLLIGLIFSIPFSTSASSILSVLISYGIWLESIPPINRATINNPVPFGTGGRSGQVMFFAAIVVLCFQYFGRQFFKAGAAALVIALSILVMAYSFSDLFRQRLLGAVSNRYVSTQERIAYAVDGLKIFASHPLIGVGTGDLPAELKKVDPHQRPGFYGGNPHNMYVMEMVQFGILGLASLLYIFYVQIRHALGPRHVTLRQVGLALPLLFLVVNFGESYLSVHATSLLFAVFSAFLYKDV